MKYRASEAIKIASDLVKTAGRAQRMLLPDTLSKVPRPQHRKFSKGYRVYFGVGKPRYGFMLVRKRKSKPPGRRKRR